jgi:hypothetical protein
MGFCQRIPALRLRDAAPQCPQAEDSERVGSDHVARNYDGAVHRRDAGKDDNDPADVAPRRDAQWHPLGVGQFQRHGVVISNPQGSHRSAPAQQRSVPGRRTPEPGNERSERNPRRTFHEDACAHARSPVHCDNYRGQAARRGKTNLKGLFAAQIRANTREPFVPPNPNELDIATRTFISREVFGT